MAGSVYDLKCRRPIEPKAGGYQAALPYPAGIDIQDQRHFSAHASGVMIVSTRKHDRRNVMTFASQEISERNHPRRPIRIAHARRPAGAVAPIATTSARPDPIAVFAHDMRGPLANLLLLLESIESGAGKTVASAVEAKARKAMGMVERLDGMLGKLIERKRRTGDPLSIDPWPVSIPDLLEQTAALNQPLASSRAVHVHVFTADPLQVLGDGHLLMQALDNLIGNAIKHSPRGGQVSIQAMPEGEEIVIRIEDEGPGFTDEDISRAFRPFTVLSAVSDSGLPSTGLGLSIVRDIVERHGGSVGAGRAHGGRGGAVTLRLPRET